MVAPIDKPIFLNRARSNRKNKNTTKNENNSFINQNNIFKYKLKKQIFSMSLSYYFKNLLGIKYIFKNIKLIN